MGKSNPQVQLIVNVNAQGSRIFHNDKGLLHNETGPAVINPRGEFAWYYDGLLHRVGGPAVKTLSGYELWMIHGRSHRVGGPATTYSDGLCVWCERGENHRIDGPAVCAKSGLELFNEWYVRGLRFTETEFNLYVDQVHGDILLPPGKMLYYGPWRSRSTHAV